MVLNLNSFCKRSLPAILLIFVAGVIVYANTFHVPFILDDHLWITQNEFMKSFTAFFANYSVFQTRFIGLLSLALNFHFGGYGVTGYHLVNILIHLLSALLVYSLLRLTFHTPYFRIQHLAADCGLHRPLCFIPLFAALLFVVHPLQTQAVNYIVQRVTSLATLFYLLSLVLYVKARLTAGGEEVRSQKSESGSQEAGKGKRRVKTVLLLFGSSIAAMLAMKTKEIAFTLPFAALLYEGCFFHGPWKRRLLFLLPLIITLPIVPVSVFVTGQSVASKSISLPVGQSVGQSAGDSFAGIGEMLRAQSRLSRLDYLFTQFRVIVTYLRLLVLPTNQNLDYDYPTYHTFLTLPVYLSFLLLASITIFALYLIWYSSPKKQIDVQKKSGSGEAQSASASEPQPALLASSLCRLVSFGIFWFFLTLSVESSLIPIQDTIAEHRLYLPSVGAAIAFSAAFFLISWKFFRKVAMLPILAGAIIIISLSVGTHQRNYVWGNAVRLWEDVASKSPQKPKVLNNLGQALNEAGRPWEAILVLKKALNLAPYFDKAYFNLGRSYLLMGQSSESIPLLRKAIEINPDFYGAYSDLGAALIRNKKYKEAITLLEQNLDCLDDVPEVHFNLGVAFLNSGNSGKARRELAILSRMDRNLAQKLADLLH